MKKAILVIATGIAAVCCAGDFVPQNQVPLDIRHVIVHHMALNVAANNPAPIIKIKTRCERLPNQKIPKNKKFPKQKYYNIQQSR